jgi:hypothetical protein
MRSRYSVVLSTMMYLLGVPSVAHAGSGWYLLSPPVSHVEGQNWAIYDNLPLRSWNQVGAFDTATGCEEVRAKGLKATRDALDELFRKENRTADDQLWMIRLGADNLARCVASDDPRLK